MADLRHKLELIDEKRLSGRQKVIEYSHECIQPALLGQIGGDMLFHLRSALNKRYVKSQDMARMTADSSMAGHFETFYVACPGGIQDGSVVQVRAIGDNAILGIDPQEFVQAGRAPHLDLAIQKVSGQPGPAIQEGDTIALRKPGPAWLPGQKYVRVEEGGLVRFVKGKREADAEFTLVKAREIAQLEAPTQGDAQGKVRLKDLAAPAGGFVVQLQSSHPEAFEVPKTVVVPEGALEAAFACSRRGSQPAPAEVVITATAVTTGDTVSTHVTAPGAAATVE